MGMIGKLFVHNVHIHLHHSVLLWNIAVSITDKLYSVLTSGLQPESSFIKCSTLELALRHCLQ